MMITFLYQRFNLYLFGVIMLVSIVGIFISEFVVVYEYVMSETRDIKVLLAKEDLLQHKILVLSGCYGFLLVYRKFLFQTKKVESLAIKEFRDNCDFTGCILCFFGAIGILSTLFSHGILRLL